MDFHDFIANVNNDLDSTWIHRETRSTMIRALIQVADFEEQDEVLVSHEDNKIILDELYNIYVLQHTLHDKNPVIDSHGEVKKSDFHELYLKSYEKIYTVVHKLQSSIFEFETNRGNIYAYDVTLKKLRYVLITMIQVYMTEFQSYAPIIQRYASILRTIFIDLWQKLIDINDDVIVQEARRNDRNIVQRFSDKMPSFVSAVYISKDNRIVKSLVKYPLKKYMIDVKDMTCDCPDFVYRRQFNGQYCKHLERFRNESGCLVLLNRVIDKHLYNVPCPLKDMLQCAYDDRFDFLPSY